MSECKHVCHTCSMVEYDFSGLRCGNTGKEVKHGDTCEIWEPNNENLLSILQKENADLRSKLESAEKEDNEYQQQMKKYMKDALRLLRERDEARRQYEEMEPIHCELEAKNKQQAATIANLLSIISESGEALDKARLSLGWYLDYRHSYSDYDGINAVRKMNIVLDIISKLDGDSNGT